MSWDDLADDVEKERLRKGPACTVRTLLDSLGDERAIVEQLIMNEAVPASALWRALTKRVGDLAPAQHTITRHRRRECNCGKGQSS
jgi:hypothetical protein